MTIDKLTLITICAWLQMKGMSTYSNKGFIWMNKVINKP